MMLQSSATVLSRISVTDRFDIATESSMMVIAFSFLSWLSTRDAHISSPRELCRRCYFTQFLSRFYELSIVFLGAFEFHHDAHPLSVYVLNHVS